MDVTMQYYLNKIATDKTNPRRTKWIYIVETEISKLFLWRSEVLSSEDSGSFSVATFLGRSARELEKALRDAKGGVYESN